MELLLNLAWLLLALPAYWLWRGSERARPERKFKSLQCLLTLGCLLVILFPVVSATDDLCATRTAMEESSVSKRSLRPASGDKIPLWINAFQSPAAVSSWAAMLGASSENWRLMSSPYLFMPAAPVIKRAGRSPPGSCLA
jgi:hypothetical protein